jgi:hypothetical protein
MEDVRAWQRWPLDDVYLVVLRYALMLTIREPQRTGGIRRISPNPPLR